LHGVPPLSQTDAANCHFVAADCDSEGETTSYPSRGTARAAVLRRCIALERA